MKSLLLLRSLIVTWMLFPLITVAGSLLVLMSVMLNPSWVNPVIRIWARGVCRLYGVKVKVHGLENLNEGGFLLLFNHASFFDIFAISSVLPEIRFGAKVELFKIPFFGAAMKSVGVIPIAREHREKSVQSLTDNQHRLASGVRVGLSPEGGRLGGEDFLAPFKSGPFHFAIGARAPIQPVLIQGASLVWPKGSLTPGMVAWCHQIDLVILPAIDTSPYSLDQRNELKDHTYKIMKEALENWRSQ